MFSLTKLRFVPARLRYVLASRSAAKSRSSRKWVRLTLERLENRLTPSTLTVTSTADDGSAGTLRAALATANTDAANGISDTINFDPSLAGGTIVLTQGQLELSGASTTAKITIDGSGLSTPVTISGNNASRVFQVDTGVQAEFDDLDIIGGKTEMVDFTDPDGGGIFNLGTLTVSGCTVSGNSAFQFGGGIVNDGTMTVNGCTLSDNSAAFSSDGGGGAIGSGGTLTITNSTFSGNSNPSRNGGAIVSYGDSSITSCTFTNNSSNGLGGAIAGLAGNLTISQCEFSQNSVPGFGGGAVYTSGVTGFTVSDSTFSSNSGYGGAITCSNATISGCTFDQNTGSGAGGIDCAGTVAVSNSTFTSNSGAITNTGALTVTNSSFSGNSNAAILSSGSTATATISNSTFTDNYSAGGYGGALANVYGSLTLTDTMISGTTIGYGIYSDSGTLTVNQCNISSNPGGAIWNNGGTASVSDSTISDNSGGINNGGGSFTIVNSTLDNNSGSSGSAIYNLGTLSISGCTLTGNSATQDGGAVSNEATGALTIDGSTLSNNTAGAGGAISNIGVSCTIANSTFEGNSAGGGGAISSSGPMTVDGCSFSGNSTSGNGGAIGTSGPLTVSNSTFTDNSAGNYGGGAIAMVFGGTADLAVSSCTFSGNTASGDGGAIIDWGAGALTVAQCAFTNNAAGTAGAIAALLPLLTVSDSTFSGNSAYAGAIWGGGQMNISTSTFDHNSGDGAGAILGDSGSQLTVTDSTFTDNSIIHYGNAAISSTNWAHNGTTLTVANCTFSGNSGIAGGVIGNGSGSATISDSTFSNNSSPEGYGGGISNVSGSMTVTNCSITGTIGSGIYSSGGSLIVNRCDISDNNDQAIEINGSNVAVSECTISDNAGGGISNNSGSLILTNSTLSGNSATDGGAIANTGALTITDSTLTGNSATNYGGAIFDEGSNAPLTIQNSTIANNSAGVGSGICLNVYNSTPAAQMQVVNTIIADNTGSPDVAGSLTSLGHNLIGITDGSSGWISSDLTGTSSSPLNPLLGPLQDNGGPTQTMALLNGSPAIDAGDNNNGGLPLPATDQCGFTRIVNGTIDIGAFEVQKTATVTTLSSSAASPLLGDNVTFTATVTAATGTPSGSVDFFDSTTGTDLGSVSLANGVAALTTSALAVGDHTIIATYSGDSSFLSSQGSTTLTVLAPSSLSGLVFEDFNDNGQVDFGELGISGVTVTLTGTDDLGQAVSQTQLSDSDGAYIFLNLRPGNYYLTETQPSGYLQGIDTVGTAGGSLSATDQFFVTLGQGTNGLNYNYGEQPSAGGAAQAGQTATIGFWNNTNGQALIKSFNGGSTSTQLGDWLAATLPNMFGANAGSNDLAGKSNADIAALFQSDFLVKGVKLDAQVLATALSVYATNATLDNTDVAANYGFIVSGDGLGTASVNVGSNGAAFGVADNSVMTVMDLLKATDAQAVGGLLYNGDATLRKEANNVYSAINEEGDIS